MTTSKDVERFNEWAPTYEQSWVQRHIDGVHQVMIEMVSRQMGEASPNSILDLGCGTGRLLRSVQARWLAANLLGVDAAKGMIEQARQLNPSAHFEVG